MRFHFAVILICLCIHSFSQNGIIKEYWKNGNLKFERKNPRTDSIYITNPKNGKSQLEVITGYDSIFFFTKEGNKIDIDSFITLYGENEINTQKEKLEIKKQNVKYNLEIEKEINRLDKLVLKSKKQKTIIDITKIELKYFYGEGDVCGNKIDGKKFIKNGMEDYIATIKAIYLNQFIDIIQYDLFVYNKHNDEISIYKNKGNYISTAMKSLILKINSDNKNDYQLTFKNIYLKDQKNNYYKINTYNKFQLFCEN